MRAMWAARQVIKITIVITLIVTTIYYIRKGRKRGAAVEKEVEDDFVPWFPSFPEGVESMSCQTLLLKMAPTISVLLVDPEYLKWTINRQNCTRNEFPPIIAIPYEFKIHPAYVDEVNILAYHNNSQSNYYTILDGKQEARGMLKSMWQTHDNVSIPYDLNVYEEMWARSKLVNCKSLRSNRENELKDLERVQPVKRKWNKTVALVNMAEIVEFFVPEGIFLSLSMDVLLGWYRECDFPVNISRFDLVMLSDEYKKSKKAFNKLESSKFQVSRLSASKGAGQHFYVVNPQHRRVPGVILSVIYFDEIKWSSYYMPSSNKRNQPRKWVQFGIRYNPHCAGDLEGYLFWVSCTPDVILRAAFGSNWTQGAEEMIPIENVKELIL